MTKTWNYKTKQQKKLASHRWGAEIDRAIKDSHHNTYNKSAIWHASVYIISKAQYHQCYVAFLSA